MSENEKMKALHLKDGKNKHGQTWDDIFRDYRPRTKYANREKKWDEDTHPFILANVPNPYRHR